MKGSRAINLFYCLCFIAVIMAPLLFFNWKGGASSENRMLASFPAWPRSFTEVSGFNDGVEAWLKDRIGWREHLVAAYRYLEINLFGQSPAPHVTLGSNGTAFLLRAEHSKVPNEEVHEAFGETGEGVSLYENQLSVLEKSAAALKKSPYPTVTVAVPTSPLFRYGDMPKFLRMALPDPPLTPDRHPVAMALKTFSDSHSEDVKFFLYPFAEALDLSKNYDPYPQKNFHWSWSPFTALVSEMLAERLGQPIVRHFDVSDFTECSTASDLTHLMGIEFTNEHDVCPSAAFYDGMELSVHPVADVFPGPGEFRSKAATYYKNTAVPAGKILVIGDSFNYSLGLPLARNFREVLVLDYYAVMRETHDNPEFVLKHIKEAYRPQQIVFIRHNTFLPFTDMPGLEVFLE